MMARLDVHFSQERHLNALQFHLMRVENESDDVRSQESTWSRLKVLATLYHGFYVFSNG